MIAFGSGGSYWGLAIACVAWGAASDAFVHGSEVALVDLAGRHLPRALGRVHLLAGLGDVLAPLLIAPAAVHGGGWRELSIGGGIVMIGYSAWLARLRLPRPARGERDPRPLRGVLDVLRDRRVIPSASRSPCSDSWTSRFLPSSSSFSSTFAACRWPLPTCWAPSLWPAALAAPSSCRGLPDASPLFSFCSGDRGCCSWAPLWWCWWLRPCCWWR
jgi:hypothetical protein